jgi:hypothetical protein
MWEILDSSKLVIVNKMNMRKVILTWREGTIDDTLDKNILK